MGAGHAIRISEIQTRERSATPGPWGKDKRVVDDEDKDFTHPLVDHEGCPVWPWYRKEDMEFAYHAREDVPYLLAVIRILEEQLATPTPESTP